MRKPLRDLALDVREIAGFNRGVPPRQISEAQKLELRKILAEVARRWKPPSGKTDLTPLEALAATAGHSVSTWHAWRRKKPTSPKFFDLRDFLRVVGLDLRLISESLAQAQPHAVILQSIGGADGAHNVMDEKRHKLLTLWERLPERVQIQLIGRMEGIVETLERGAANPNEPIAEDENRDRDRRSSQHNPAK